ncbi:MAG: ribosome biogenesis GTPase Der [Lentisphaeria bacterium]
MDTNQLPIIAIIGRPNVGKSSLFNKIVGRRVSIVHEQSGVTRDRIAAPVSLEHHHFLLVDTGGLGVFTDDTGIHQFDEFIRAQVTSIIDEATHIIWMVDAQDGLTPLDDEIARLLKSHGCSVTVVANKADNTPLREGCYSEFAALPVEEPVIPLSCTHNINIDTVIDACLEHLPHIETEPDLKDPGLKLAVVGRPNVGKSSLVNKLLGEERVIVSDIPGTTRDAVDIPIEIVTDEEKIPLTLIDTAGVRRRRQVNTVVEHFSVMRAENAIKRSDAVILVLDANAPATSQDRRIARIIADSAKPCIIAANKWDTASANMKLRNLVARLERDMAFMNYAPIYGVCALSGYNMSHIMQHVMTIREQANVSIPTSVFNQFLQDTITRTPPPSSKGKSFKILYGTMIGNPPPQFKLFVNDPKRCNQNYRRFLITRIREAFFPEKGMPIRLQMRSRRETGKRDRGQDQAIAGVKRKETQQKKQGKSRKKQRRRRK